MIFGLRAAIAVAACLVWPSPPPRAQSPVTTAPSVVLRELDGVGELQSLFDRDRQRIRIVLLLTPTWPACLTGARWAQHELLERRPALDLRVYAVWFNMYPGDARARWPSALLTDARVAHYWDENRAAGVACLSYVPAMMNRRAAATPQPPADAMWDAFFLYAPGDQWQAPVPLPLSWGYPIMVTRDQLLRELDAVVGKWVSCAWLRNFRHDA